MLAGWAVACLSSYHQASTISFKTNSSAQCTGQVLKNDMEKSLEELVIKLRYYKIDVGSGAGIEIYLSQSKNFNYVPNHCQTEIISLKEFFFCSQNRCDQWGRLHKKSYFNLFW